VLRGDPGDGGIAPQAFLNFPSGMTVDSSGNLYIADAGGQRIRKINPAGIITTVAGNGTAGFSGDGGSATAAQLNWPKDVAIDAAGNLYIADTGNSSIRKVTSAGIITTIAGNGTAGFYGDGGLATNAQLNQPTGVALDASGNVYFSDTYNFRVRKADTGGVISTIAGTGVAAYSGDGIPGTSAALAYPTGLKVDAAGNLFLADWVSVRKITASGIISTIAGTGAPGFSGDGGPAASANIGAWGIALDPAGRILIADPWNNTIRALQPVH
jgi:sugar lactone lactonase YvrE